MIPQITEVNFPAYATLSNATASFADMGDRVISTEVKIDGEVVPDFTGWELLFRGERFVLNVKDPQAAKDNTSICSKVSLTFYSWPILQLKRFFAFTVQTTATGQVTADKYNASVSLTLSNFCAWLNEVLNYYFSGKIYVDLATGVNSEEAMVEMNYAYIWDVIQKIYETFGVKWRIVYVQNTDSYVIRVGYSELSIDDHDFEYGFQGGLMRFERQVQDVDIRNILLGRGGTQNVPYRYFKDTDPQNPDWAADPDYVPELANVYFDRIRDANFRRYIQGWRTNRNGALGAIDTYDSTRAATDWAYEKGHTDTAFDPVEYVKDDPSILRYGERWGHLDDNDEIYPTIQGITVDGFRVDTVMDVSPILSDDIYAAADGAAAIVDIDGVMTQTDTVAAGLSTKEIRGSSFTVPTGRTANLMDNGFFVRSLSAQRSQRVRLTVNIDNSFIKVYDQSTGTEVNRDGIPAGTYYYVITVQVYNLNQSAVPDVTYGVNGLYLMTSAASSGEWSPTFDIYVCNLFNTTQGANESDEDYAIRVWQPILGDRLGNEAKVVFSDGPMSISEDYEFPIATYPMPDRSKTFGGVTSEWRITLNKCDAEFDATGLYIPNAETGGKPVAGNHFFFIGIDMPHFYVTEAEKRLTAYKEAALPDHAEANPTWVITLDKIRIDQQYNLQHERLIDKIDAGVGLSVYDVRFSGGQTLSLYASSVTFTWADGTVILPEVDVVLTEKTSVVKSSYQELQHDVSVIKATYATEDGASSASREQSKQLFLGKNGEAQTSLSPTRFASIIASENFKQGEFGGKGWGFYEDNSDLYQDKDGVDEDLIEKQSVLEVDRLVVRRDMMLNKLVVNQTAYFGGRQVISAAAVECTLVVENQGNYICYFDQKQGSVKNLFHLNDVAMSQTFDGSNNVTRYYRRLVIAVGLDYITLSGSVVSGSDIPRVGDTIVQYGNTVDEDRQYAIVRDVIGGGREFMMSNLNSVSATGNEYFYAGIKAIEGPAGTSGLAQAPYFFIGNQDSHIKFNSRKQKTYIKGGLVLSPAGTEFPVPCYRGDYDQNATYYPGDLVVYNGESWLHQGDTAITGVAPGTGSSWHKYAAKGASAYRLDLSNEFSTVNVDSSGAIVPGAVLPSCRAQLYEGTSVLDGTVYSVATPQDPAATGVSINPSSGELQFSNSFAFTGDTLEVSVTANNTAKGVAMTAIMTVAKIHPGSDGTPATSYWIVLDTDKVSVDPNVTPRVPNPPTVKPTAMMQVGGNAPQAATGCTLEYFYDNETAQTIASGTELTIALKNGDTVRKTLHFNLKKGSTVVDQESVPILYDGEKGEDGASYILIPSCTMVKKDATGALSTQNVTCGASAANGDELPEYYIYYSLDGGVTKTLYEKKVNGTVIPAIRTEIPAVSITTSLTFFLYLVNPEADPLMPTFSDYVNIATIPLVIDGQPGEEGDVGKSMRGISNWSEYGYGGTSIVPSSYMGKEDEELPYYDIVIDPTDELFYQCIYQQNPESQKLATAAPPSSNLITDATPGCWQLMNNYENIATMALAVSDAVINNLKAQKIVADQLETATKQIKIAGDQITLKDSTAQRALIHSHNLSAAGTGSNVTVGTVSGNGSAGVASIDLNILGSSTLSINAANNFVAVPNIVVTASLQTSAQNSVPPLIREWFVTFIARSATDETTISNRTSYMNLLGATIPGFTTTLPVGTGWSIICRIEPSAITSDYFVHAESAPETQNAVVAVTYPVSNGFSEMAGNGFQTIWTDNNSRKHGFVASASGTKVFKDGVECEALGGQSLNSLAALKKIVICTAYPRTTETGVLYVKVST